MSEKSSAKKEALNTPEFVHWRAHRKFILNVPRSAVGFRGAAALGMCIENSGNWIAGSPRPGEEEPTFYVPDSDITWLTLQDLPMNHWATAMAREVHLAAARRTTQRFGMPSLRWNDLVGSWDFRLIPAPQKSKRALPYASNEESFDPRQLQYFRAFNALNWAMTSTAVHYRTDGWIQNKKAFYEMFGLEYKRDKVSLMFGEGIFTTAEQPYHWAPRPILGFKAQNRKHLFESSIANANGTREFGDDFRWEFIRSLEAGMPIVAHHDGKLLEVRRNQEWHGMPVVHLMVKYVGVDKPQGIIARPECLVDHLGKFKRGDVLGYDGPKLPKHWKTLPGAKKWLEAQTIFKSNFLNVMHLWFDRQIMDLKEGFIHVSAALSAKAALSSAVESELFWDVTRSMPYYNPACDALIFPTLRMHGWDDFRHAVGELDLDLTPEDSRFRLGRKPKQWQPLDREGRKLQGKLNAAKSKPKKIEEAEVVEAVIPDPVYLEPEQVVVPELSERQIQAKVASDRKIAARKTRQAAKANRTGTAKPESRSAYLTPPTPAVKDEEIEELARLLHLPQVDKTAANNQPKIEALRFEGVDPKVVARFRRAYLPKSHSNQVDLASISDHDLAKLMALKK